ncbi:hypothetical protein ASG67_15240 [Sphingomonas sp. Leaf339]|nr:PEPxxWA-CTERM sorting domain-containing protein [Sphingomonas sp. Leaf339]KQU45969.1 hypothetical protein ASG67_15240 [Sphingomonas sp. Leaf339]
MKAIHLAAVAVFSFGTTSAQAAVFNWKISGAFTGSGQLTTTDTPFIYDKLDDPISGQSGSGYLVTAMTGKFASRGSTLRDVSLVKADPNAAPYWATNLLYPSGAAPFLDSGGLLFKTSVRTYALFGMETCSASSGAGDATDCTIAPAIGYPGIGESRAVTFTITAVPEPGTWAMMLVGFGMVASVARYRRRKTNIVYA